MLVVGEKEQAAGTVAVRDESIKDMKARDIGSLPGRRGDRPLPAGGGREADPQGQHGDGGAVGFGRKVRWIVFHRLAA